MFFVICLIRFFLLTWEERHGKWIVNHSQDVNIFCEHTKTRTALGFSDLLVFRSVSHVQIRRACSAGLFCVLLILQKVVKTPSTPRLEITAATTSIAPVIIAMSPSSSFAEKCGLINCNLKRCVLCLRSADIATTSSTPQWSATRCTSGNTGWFSTAPSEEQQIDHLESSWCSSTCTCPHLWIRAECFKTNRKILQDNGKLLGSQAEYFFLLDQPWPRNPYSCASLGFWWICPLSLFGWSWPCLAAQFVFKNYLYHQR